MKINEIITESTEQTVDEGKTRPGLWANIHAKRKRGAKMRKKGAPGAPTEKALKAAQAGSKNESVQQGVAEGSGEILPRGTSVTVVHKGKQVPGKIVRYDAGKGGYSDAYVVDVGGYESIFVPANKIQQGVAEDWQKTNKQDKTDGMSSKAVKAYRRENPGSKLKTAVTKKPSKLKAGSKDANRRKSFCARMSGNKGPMKDEKGRPTPKAKALKRWNCNEDTSE